jgi:hypothetical protein
MRKFMSYHVIFYDVFEVIMSGWAKKIVSSLI